jgi:hypothetical protein
MKLPNNDHNIQVYERENYPSGGNGMIPTWLRSEKGLVAKEQKEWIEGMTAEEWEKHLKREAEYQQSLGNNKYY